MRKVRLYTGSILCSLSSLLIMNNVHSQVNQDLLTNATKNFQIHNYALASIDLSTIIKQANNLKGKKGGSIYNMYSKCLLNFLQTNNDTILIRLDILKSNLPIVCFDSYKQTLQCDKDLKSEVTPDLQKLYPYLIQNGLKLANINFLIYANYYINAAKLIN